MNPTTAIRIVRAVPVTESLGLVSTVRAIGPRPLGHFQKLLTRYLFSPAAKRQQPGPQLSCDEWISKALFKLARKTSLSHLD